MPAIGSPRTGKDIDLQNQLSDLKNKLSDPSLPHAKKQELYDQRLRVENKLRSIRPQYDYENYGVSPDILNQINQPADQEIPIGQPVGNFAQNREKENNKSKPEDPEKYKEQGGPAPKAKRKGLLDRFRKSGQDEAKGALEDKAKGTAANVARNTSKQLVSQAVNFAKKAAIQAGTKIAAAASAGNPIFWIIVAIIAFAIIIVILWGVFIGAGGKSPNPQGTTFVQAVDPLKDKDIVRKILALTGDSSIGNKIGSDLLSDLNIQILKLKEEIKDSHPSAYKLIGDLNTKDTLLFQINALLRNDVSDREKEVKILISLLSDLEKIFWNVTPLDKTLSASVPYSFNGFGTSPHYATPYRPCVGNNSYCTKKHRTFKQFKENTCDAADLKNYSSDKKAVSPVLSGKVTKLEHKDNYKNSNIWITTQHGGKTIETVYAHLTDIKVSMGQQVSGGKDVIGYVLPERSSPYNHLHFELAINNQCVVINPNEKNLENIEANEHLWKKMKVVLNLP